MSLPRFKCDCCGLCCRLIGNIPQLKHFDRGDGTCRHLTEENLCDIYETRPDVCRVDRMYSHFKDHMAEADYVRAVEAACKVMKNNFRALKAAQAADDCCVAGDGNRFRSDAVGVIDSLPKQALGRLAREICEEKDT